MVSNTARASLSSDDASPARFNEYLHSCQNVDFEGSDIVFDTMPQELASNNTFPATYTKSFARQGCPSNNPQPDFGICSWSPPLMSPTSDDFGQYHYPMANCETTPWPSPDKVFGNIQNLSESPTANINATVDTPQNPDNTLPESYGSDNSSHIVKGPLYKESFAEGIGFPNLEIALPSSYFFQPIFVAHCATCSCTGAGFSQAAYQNKNQSPTTPPTDGFPNPFQEPLSGFYGQDVYDSLHPSFSNIPALEPIPSMSPEEASFPQSQPSFPEFQSQSLTTINVSETVDEVPASLQSKKIFLANSNTGSGPSTSRRPRKSFSTEGKRKVNGVRVLGACVGCRAGKLSVSCVTDVPK